MTQDKWTSSSEFPRRASTPVAKRLFFPDHFLKVRKKLQPSIFHLYTTIHWGTFSISWKSKWIYQILISATIIQCFQWLFPRISCAMNHLNLIRTVDNTNFFFILPHIFKCLSQGNRLQLAMFRHERSIGQEQSFACTTINNASSSNVILFTSSNQ